MLFVEEFPTELINFFNDLQEILKCSKLYIFNTHHPEVYQGQQLEPDPIGGFFLLVDRIRSGPSVATQ